MADVWGQRSLLGFGVLVAWLVLFHLLVNIWLLCAFTSLLLVLGGWLGSQVLLESNGVVHLERFFTLEQIPPSVEDEKQLDQEIQNTVSKIIRDFVSSWYSTVSTERGFEMEVQEAMVSMAMELKMRARRVDRKVFTQRLLNMWGCHLQTFLVAKEIVAKEIVAESSSTEGGGESDRLWKVYAGISLPHPATASPTTELSYARALVDLTLHVLAPPLHLESRTGRSVVGELITCNVLLPLIAKLSDPDWLNVLLLQIFSKSALQREPATATATASALTSSPSASPPAPAGGATAEEPRQDPPEPPTRSCPESLRLEPDVTGEEAVAKPVAGVCEADGPDDAYYPHGNTEDEEPAQPFLRCYLSSAKSNPFYQEVDSDVDSPSAEYNQSSLDSLTTADPEEGLCDGLGECVAAGGDHDGVDAEEAYRRCPKVLVVSASLDQHNGCATDYPEGESTSTSAPPHPLGEEQTGLGNSDELVAVASPSRASSPMAAFSFEPLSSPEGPVIIQNLRITGTITAKEHRGTGSHPYTLYTVKYETAMGCEHPGCCQPGSEDAEALQAGCEMAVPVQPVAYHMVNRRYSEFLNLQTRLEEKPELRRLIKGVKGPKKIFPDMPFGNMDSDKIEARKGLLETFLKQLCAIPETANSEEMQEFLALNTDARIAFVKKPFIVSRIDKIVVNAIVDTLKTAFPRSEPQSPTEDDGEVDGVKVKIIPEKKNRNRLKFSSRNTNFMNGPDIKPQVLFCWEPNGTVFNSMSLASLDAFITEQEHLLCRAPVDPEPEGDGGFPVKGPATFSGCPLGLEISPSGNQTEDSACETELADVALNIVCVLMRGQWSWLCTENIQKAIRLLFGTFINRWLEVGVAKLMCTQYWVAYLQVLQEAVWPGGCLPAEPRPDRTRQQREESRLQALHCLMQLLPELVSDVLGSDKYKLSWQTALDSLQDSYINRHLVYCIWDLLLEFLVPEIPDEDFQRSLLHSISKGPS